MWGIWFLHNYTTPSQQLHNNSSYEGESQCVELPSYEGESQYVGPTLMWEIVAQLLY